MSFAVAYTVNQGRQPFRIYGALLLQCQLVDVIAKICTIFFCRNHSGNLCSLSTLSTVFTVHSVVTDQSDELFWSSSKFEARIYFININASLEQNQLLNAALELKSLPPLF